MADDTTISDAIAAVTEGRHQAELDHLGDTAQTIRAAIKSGLNDPSSIWFGRADLLEAAEFNISLTYAGMGAAPPLPLTPQQEAQRQHDTRFSATLNPNLTAMLAERREALEALSEPVLKGRVAELRQVVGAKEYDQLVGEARTGLGADLPLSMQADLATLRVLAAQGRYVKAREATRPRSAAG